MYGSFMFGPAPVRRTLQYLSSAKLIFKDKVKIMEVHYNMYWKYFGKEYLKPIEDAHRGAREFYFWDVPRIQYKNPQVQVVRFLEMTPTPFIRCWLDDGRDVLFDCDGRSKEQIMHQLTKTLGKTDKLLAVEEQIKSSMESKDNPAIFGWNRERFCMCEIPGQVPCPGVVDLPKRMQGKYYYYNPEELEKEEKQLLGLEEEESIE